MNSNLTNKSDPKYDTAVVGSTPSTPGRKVDEQLAMQLVTHFAMTGNSVKTGKYFNVHHNTVLAHVAKHPELYAVAREHVKVKTMAALDTFIDEALTGDGGVLSDPDRIKAAGLRDLLVSVAIAIDKSAMLAGEATLRMEVDVDPKVVDTARKFLEFFSQLPKEALREIEAADFTLIDDQPPTPGEQGTQQGTEPQRTP